MKLENSVIPDLWAQFISEGVGDSGSVNLPWSKLSHLTNAIRPGCVCLLGGPQNTGKSFFCTLIALHVHNLGHSWCYLPLEDDRMDFMRRVLAVLSESYRIIDDDAIASDWRNSQLTLHREKMFEIESHIWENPRKPVTLDDGTVKIPKLTQDEMLGWLKNVLPENRVVFIDPTTQIEFVGRQQWQVENDFIRDFLGLVAEHKSTLIMVTHTKNLSRLGKGEQISAEHIQGSTLWAKLCHTLILLDSHDDKESEIYMDGYQSPATHNRTIYIAKARNAKGEKKRFAFVQNSERPDFDEIGVIAPKKNKSEIRDVWDG